MQSANECQHLEEGGVTVRAFHFRQMEGGAGHELDLKLIEIILNQREKAYVVKPVV